jgi:isochorismate synthase
MNASEPPFALCGPTGTLIPDGVRTCYAEVTAAQAELRSGRAPIVLGALPFDVDGLPQFMVPGAVLRVVRRLICRPAAARGARRRDGPDA